MGGVSDMAGWKNSKSETRNPKQNPNAGKWGNGWGRGSGNLYFSHFKPFGFVSNFVLRISDFF
jgi:hypothetical protein